MSVKTDEQVAEDWEKAKLTLQFIVFPVLCLIGGGALGYIQGAVEAMRDMQSEAVARGVAGYDETTGEWKWTVERKVAE